MKTKKIVLNCLLAATALGFVCFTSTVKTHDKVEDIIVNAQSDDDAYRTVVKAAWWAWPKPINPYTTLVEVKETNGSVTNYATSTNNNFKYVDWGAADYEKYETLIDINTATMPEYVACTIHDTKGKITKTVGYLVEIYYKGTKVYHNGATPAGESYSFVGGPNAIFNNTINPFIYDGVLDKPIQLNSYTYTMNNVNTSNMDKLPSKVSAPEGFALPKVGGNTFTNPDGSISTYDTIPTSSKVGEGLRFAGYFDQNYRQYYDINNQPIEDVIATSNQTLKAEFEYPVTLNCDGGDFVYTTNALTKHLIDNSYYIADVETRLPTLSKTGYDFLGWVNKDGESVTTIPAVSMGHREYTAQFQIKNFTVSFDTDGGSLISPQTVDYMSYAKRPFIDPTKPSDTLNTYLFDNWYDSEGEIFDFESTPITSSITVYAHYLTNVEVDEFVNDFMHPEIEDDDVGTGLCLGAEGRYSKAKEAFNALPNEARIVFWNNTDYARYKTRLIAWAKANNDVVNVEGIINNAPFAELNITFPSKEFIVITTIGGATVLITTVLVLILLKKRKHN